MATAIASPTEALVHHLDETFFKAYDGLWYPRQSGEALVRLEVGVTHYRIFRRRSPETPWMLLVESRVEEFDKDNFNTWASRWQLVA